MFDDLVAQNFDDDPCVVVHACGVQETTLGREGTTHHRASARTTNAACDVDLVINSYVFCYFYNQESL